ncbi:MAG: tetratricopeptide repeat protein [Gemmatimonadetes bacterium]|nr:tetratricopeptide repeat protein [Gemmatimonadota bacterium]
MDAEAVLEQALGLGDEGRWPEMAQLLAEAVRADAEADPYLLCWWGVAERELGNESAAYDAFKRCLAAEPVDPQLLALAGSGLAAFHDPDAESALRAAALTAPDSAFTRLQYGAFLAREGMYREAIEHLEAAHRIEPEDPASLSELGIAHALHKDFKAASGALERTLELAPDDSWTRVLLGLVYSELGDDEQAAETLMQAADERPDDGEAQVLAALAAAAVGWDEAALGVLARAEYAHEPPDPDAIAEAEEALEEGADAAADLLLDTYGPAALHDRLIQPL